MTEHNNNRSDTNEPTEPKWQPPKEVPGTQPEEYPPNPTPAPPKELPPQAR